MRAVEALENTTKEDWWHLSHHLYDVIQEFIREESTSQLDHITKLGKFQQLLELVDVYKVNHLYYEIQEARTE